MPYTREDMERYGVQPERPPGAGILYPGEPAPGGPPPAAAPPGPALAPPQVAPQAVPQAAPQAQAPPAPGQPEEQAKADMQQTIDKAAEKTSNTDQKVAEQVTNQLEEMNVDVDQAYDEWVKKMGGFKEPDMKFTKEQKGLFLMDFGMRLMAAGSRWNSNIGGAIGEAGLGTMQQVRGEQERRRGAASERNEQIDTTAREMTRLQAERGALGEVLETTEGLYGVSKTGKATPIRGIGGEILQQDPAASGRRGGGRPLEIQVIKSWYKDMGFSDAEASEMAKAKGPNRVVQDMFEEIATLKKDPVAANGKVKLPDGTEKKVRHLDDDDIAALAERRFGIQREAAKSILSGVRGEQQGAL